LAPEHGKYGGRRKEDRTFNEGAPSLAPERRYTAHRA